MKYRLDFLRVVEPCRHSGFLIAALRAFLDSINGITGEVHPTRILTSRYFWTEVAMIREGLICVNHQLTMWPTETPFVFRICLTG